MNSHRDLCKIAAEWLLSLSSIDLATWEFKIQRGSIGDAVGITSSPKARYPAVHIVEVKRTRADLLADLRAKKMLKYERVASHCWLALTPEALGHKSRTRVPVSAITDLKNRGLPLSWGVLLLPTEGTSVPRVLRRPKRLRTPRRATLAKFNRRIAKSFMYRILNHNSPMEEQQ